MRLSNARVPKNLKYEPKIVLQNRDAFFDTKRDVRSVIRTQVHAFKDALTGVSIQVFHTIPGDIPISLDYSTYEILGLRKDFCEPLTTPKTIDPTMAAFCSVKRLFFLPSVPLPLEDYKDIDPQVATMMFISYCLPAHGRSLSVIKDPAGDSGLLSCTYRSEIGIIGLAGPKSIDLFTQFVTNHLPLKSGHRFTISYAPTALEPLFQTVATDLNIRIVISPISTYLLSHMDLYRMYTLIV
jgi:hypothetical protein